MKSLSFSTCSWKIIEIEHLVVQQTALQQIGGSVELARLNIDVGEQKPAFLEVFGFLCEDKKLISIFWLNLNF